MTTTIAKIRRTITRLSLGTPAAREPGLLRGRIELSDDFNTPLAKHLLALFEGGSVRRCRPAKRKRKRA